MIRVLTVCNSAYLAQASILAESIRENSPGTETVLMLVEERFSSKRYTKFLRRFDRVLFPEDVLGEDRFRFLFPYDVVEACTAIKPATLRYLLVEDEDTSVVYLDPDTAVFSPLEMVNYELENHSAILSPHLLRPTQNDDWSVADEITSLKTGVYNLGFIALRPTNEARALLDWWSERLLRWCLDDVSLGLFTDQKWMNLAPIFFPTIEVSRHPGLNVASWNIQERSISFSPRGEFEVDGRPLVFFHFTKLGSIGLAPLMRKGAGNGALFSIIRWYQERLYELSKELAGTGTTSWSYGFYFDSRGAVGRESRRAFSRVPWDLRDKNPFFQVFA